MGTLGLMRAKFWFHSLILMDITEGEVGQMRIGSDETKVTSIIEMTGQR